MLPQAWRQTVSKQFLRKSQVAQRYQVHERTVGRAVTLPPLPDMQALVHQYGGYHRIPNGVWADHYNRLITVQVWLTMRHFPPGSRRYSGPKLKWPRAPPTARHSIFNRQQVMRSRSYYVICDQVPSQRIAL